MAIEIHLEYKPQESPSDEEMWIVTICKDGETTLFYGEISKPVYDALIYQEQQIKELKEYVMVHKDECEMWQGRTLVINKKCTCGLEKLLKQH